MIEQSNFKKLRVFGSMILGKTAVLMAQMQSGKFASSTRAGVFAAVNGGTAEVITASRTLTVEDSGKTFALSAAATLTLPSLASAPGFKATFINTVDGLYTVSSADGAVMQGLLMGLSTGGAVLNKTNVNFSGASLRGDRVDVNAVGGIWSVSGAGQATTSFTST